MTKLINENKIDWDEHLPIILFSYRTTYKVVTVYTILAYLWVITFNAYKIHSTSHCNNHKKGNPMKVLTSRVLELEKLQDDRLQFEVKLRI